MLVTGTGADESMEIITTRTSGRDGGESRAKWKRTRRLWLSNTVTGNRLPAERQDRKEISSSYTQNTQNQTSFLGIKPISDLVYLLGLMDSKGTKTSVRETSAEEASVWEGDTSSSVALRLGWELGTGAGGSAVKAGIGFGAMFVPVLFWRSLRVGLDCCLSLREEEWATLCQLLLWALKWFWSAFPRNSSLTNSWLNVDAVQTTKVLWPSRSLFLWIQQKCDRTQILLGTIWPAGPLEVETAAAGFFPAGPVHPRQSYQEWSQMKEAESGEADLDSKGDWALLQYLYQCCQRTESLKKIINRKNEYRKKIWELHRCNNRFSPPLTWNESHAVESSGCEAGLEVCVPSLKPVWGAKCCSI